MPDITLSGDRLACEYHLKKNSVKCSSHPAYSKAHFTIYKMRTPIPATNGSTTPIQKF